MSASLTSPRWFILTCLVQFDLSEKVFPHRLHLKLLKSSFSTYLDASPKIRIIFISCSLKTRDGFALHDMSFQVSFGKSYSTVWTTFLVKTEMFFSNMSPTVLRLGKISPTNCTTMDIADSQDTVIDT